MSAKAFERRALSEALRDCIGGRKVLAAVFTTYSFDPRFFELEVLPLLFARAFSKEPTVRLVQLDEALRSTQVAVYFDRAALCEAGGGGSLGIQTFGIRRADARGATKGCFHPKLCLALVQDQESDEQALVVAVMSANLTQAGHWSNVECVWLDELSTNEPCSYRDDLLNIVKTIRVESGPSASGTDGADTQHDALDYVGRFLKRIERSDSRVQGGWFLPRLFYGQRTFGAFLRDELNLPPNTYHLEIISPYFDDGEALRKLVDEVKPLETRVLLPLCDDNSGGCERDYFETVNKMTKVHWARFESAEYLKQAANGPGDLRRSVHAKVYRLWSKSESGEFLVLGSLNLTKQAHSERHGGNFEVAVVLENRDPILQRCLVPIDQAPSEFGVSPELADEAAFDQREACPLLLRFHWKSRRLEGFWDAPTHAPRVDLSVGGVNLPESIDGLPASEWTELPRLAEHIAEHLARSSLVQVHVIDAEPNWIVVQEEDLLQKPSLLCNLTAEEILRYWSALSDAQRQALLERAEVRRLQAAGVLPPLQEKDGMFDRFAGVFHAFERLREHVEQAIADGDDHEAEYRLFANKHDSLPHLIERLLDREAADAGSSVVDPDSSALAVSYATYLSAQRLLRQLETSNSEFLRTHADDMKRLRGTLEKAATLRTRVVQQCEGDGQRFVDWFDDWFLGKRDRGAA